MSKKCTDVWESNDGKIISRDKSEIDTYDLKCLLMEIGEDYIDSAGNAVVYVLAEEIMKKPEEFRDFFNGVCSEIPKSQQDFIEDLKVEKYYNES